MLFVLPPPLPPALLHSSPPSLTHQEGLDGEEDGADLKGGRPLVLEDVQADATELVDVGMVHLGQEADLGRGHGVIGGEEEFQLECAL